MVNVNNDKILKFYKEALEKGMFNPEFLQELKNISTEAELRSFINKRLRKLAKEMGYNFSTEELFAYEKNAIQKIADEDLENIGGGTSLKSVILSGGIFSLSLLGMGNIIPIQADAAPEVSTAQQQSESSSKFGTMFRRVGNKITSSFQNWMWGESDLDQEIQAQFEKLASEIEEKPVTTPESDSNSSEAIEESVQSDNQTVENNQNDVSASAVVVEPDSKISSDTFNAASATLPLNGTISGINYNIDDEFILLTGDESNPIDIVEIPQALRDFGIKFEIGEGIKSLTLQGDEEVESTSWDLEKADVSRSTKYIASDDGSVLYEKKANGTKGECLIIIKDNGTIGNINYEVDDCIALTGDKANPIDITEIPQALRDLGRKFEIGEGIKSLTLQGDEEIDISSASDLEYIDLENSNKYINKFGHLYTKDQKTDLGWINKSVLIKFSLDRINEMPKDEESIKTFLTVLDEESLREDRAEEIIHEDGSKETIVINEKEVYAQIKAIVDDLIIKVNRRSPALVYTEDEINKRISNKEYSEHYLKDKQSRIAKAIYRWVAKNISYDDESIIEDKKDASGNLLKLRKPQDAIFVFNQKKGVCEGYARLASLMMRLAGIPSCELSTLTEDDSRHSYNAVYLNGGWTLIDATWASPDSDSDSAKFISPSTSPEAVKIDEKSLKQLSVDEKASLKELFPQFYSEDVDSQDAINKQILDMHFHIIKDRTGFDKNDVIEFKSTDKGIKFRLVGSVDNPRILIEGDSKTVENLTLPDKLIRYNLPFKIGKGIKSLILQGNERIERGSWDLEKVDVSRSTKYIASADGSVLYEKEEDGTAGECLFIIKDKGTIGNINYKFKLFYDCIALTGDKANPIDIPEIPRALRDFGIKFEIGDGIKSLTLQGDEEIESKSWDLEKVDVSRSTKYIASDDGSVLYEKKANGTTGACLVIIKDKGTIGNINYEVFDDCIALTGDRANPIDITEIPQALRDLGEKFEIREGIKSLTLQGDEEIESKSWDLEKVDVSRSTKYIASDDGSVLYEKKANGTKGECLIIIKDNGTIGNINYEVFDDCIALTGDKANPLNITEIPQILRDLGEKFEIGEGIKSLTLHGSDEINIIYAKDLKRIDSSNSNRYTRLNIMAKFLKKFVVKKLFLLIGEFLPK